VHKNTVQYRLRRAEESLGRPVGENQHDVELALRACLWLGSCVLVVPRGLADHSLLAVSGPVMRRSSGNVAPMRARASTSPAAVRTK